MRSEPREATLARRIDFTLQKMGHRHVETPEDADFQIVPISYDTPASCLEEAIRHKTPPVFILCAPIVLDPDSVAVRYQWIDYRSRSQGRLNTMAAILKKRASPQLRERQDYESYFVPLNFQKMGFPEGVRLSTLLMRYIAILLCVTLTGLPLGWWLWRLAGQIRRRGVILSTGVVGALLITFLATGVFVLIMDGLLNVSSGQDSDILNSVGQWLILLLIVLPVLFFAALSGLRLWLPAPGPLSEGPYIATL